MAMVIVNISTLNGVVQAWSMAYVCSNSCCAFPKTLYKSADRTPELERVHRSLWRKSPQRVHAALFVLY